VAPDAEGKFEEIMANLNDGLICSGVACGESMLVARERLVD
jgi:hypothetical protein